MISLGGKCDNECKNYFCYFYLDGRKVVCSYDEISGLPENLDCVHSVYLNPTMLLECNVNDKYILYVEGPDGGVYYELQTDITKNDFVRLLRFFKTMTN